MSSPSGSNRNMRAPELKPLGVDPDRTSTNEQARPVPYMLGRRRVPLTWLSNVFNVAAKPIKQKVGKKRQVVGYNYHASFAGLICVGAVDGIEEVYADNELIWSGTLTRTEFDDYEDLTIETRGQVRIYWGTETQDADPHLLTSGEDHPPYRGQAYMVFDSFALGENRTNVPNVEVVVSRYTRADWMSASPQIGDDTSLISVIAEWMQNPRYGLGLSDDFLDTIALDAVANQIQSEDISVSPLVTRQESMRELLIHACEYIDGYISTNDDGEIGIGLVRPVPDPGALPELTENDHVDEPQLSIPGWDETHNLTHVVYANRAREYKEDAVAWYDTGNFRILGEPRAQVLRRPWLTRTDVANQLAAVAGKVAGLPLLSGTSLVRRRSAEGLDIGSLFRLSWDEYGLTDLVCRVIGRQVNATDRPSVQLSWRVDRGSLVAVHYTPQVDDPPDDPFFDPDVMPWERIIEAPLGLPDSIEPGEQLVILGARSNLIATGFNVHLKLPSTEFELVGDHDRFAVRGHVLTEYPDDTTLIDQVERIHVQIDSPDNEWDNRPLEDVIANDVLLYVGDEIMAPFDAELLAPNEWRISVIRARYDTIKQAHAVDAEVFIQTRGEGAYHPARPELPTQTYKLQPFSINREVDIGLVDEIDVTTTHRSLRPLRPLNIAANGETIEGFYASSGDVEFTWDISMEIQPPFWSIWLGGISQNLPETVLQFRDIATDDLVSQVVIAPGIESYTYMNGAIVADFGAEVSFRVRAYHRRNSFLSRHYSAVLVTLL